MPPLLDAQGVSRTYDRFQALANTDLQLYPGEIVTLTGPNGSGKTTLLLCLSGLLAPTTGSIKVEGFDLVRDEVAVRKRMAFVPDVPHFYSELTAWEHLRFMALAHEATTGFDSRAEDLLKEFDLWEGRNLFPHHYSRGMRMKLGLLLAFIRPFHVLLLDEPTSALDTQGVDQLITRLKELRAQGAGILFSTHDQDLALSLGDRHLRMRSGVVEAV